MGLPWIRGVACAGIASLAACGIDEINLLGKGCPCVAGFVCEPASNTCRVDDGKVLGPLILAEEFDDDLSAWAEGGPGGTWALSGGELMQTDRDGAGFLHATGLLGASDYHIESRMRQLHGDPDVAMELHFRTTLVDGAADQYFCNWEPNSGDFLMMSQAGDATLWRQTREINLASLPAYDPLAPITMHVQASGPNIECWLDEIPAARIQVSDGEYPVGTIGPKVYALAAAYDYIRVWELVTPP